MSHVQLNPSLLTHIQAFKQKRWNSEDNRNLLDIIKNGDSVRLNIAPATIYSLDKIGLNHLEIISLANCIGHLVHKQPIADVDFLNYLQERYQICFDYDVKKKNPLKAKCKSIAYQFRNETPMGEMALFSVTDLYKIH